MNEKIVEKIIRKYLIPARGFNNLHVQTVAFRLLHKPYGLIQSHFDISLKEARIIVRTARKHIPRKVLDGIRQKLAA